MKAVADATPLIHLGKIGKLICLKKLFDKIIIPKEIYFEIMAKDKEHKNNEMLIIETLINEKFIEIADSPEGLNFLGLDSGELKAMSLCQKLKIKTILIDEKEGFDVASILGLKPVRTTSLLLILLNKKLISFLEYEKNLLNLSKSGYFMSAATYKILLDAGKNMNKR